VYIHFLVCFKKDLKVNCFEGLVNAAIACMMKLDCRVKVKFTINVNVHNNVYIHYNGG